MRSVAIHGPCQLDENVRASLHKQHLTLTEDIDIARNCYFNLPAMVYPNCSIFKIKMDAYSYIHHHSTVINTEIGRYCSLGHRLDIGMGYHYYKGTFTSPVCYGLSMFQETSGPIDYHPEWLKNHANGEITNHVTIGHDVWVGGHVKIPSDVTIGTGAVLGAGAVINKDVPPYAIINARGEHVKNRFSDELISDLLASEWWNYDLPVMTSQKLIDPRFQEDPRILLQIMKDSDLSTWPKIQDQWHALLVFAPDKAILSPINPATDQGFTYVNLPDSMVEELIHGVSQANDGLSDMGGGG